MNRYLRLGRVVRLISVIESEERRKRRRLERETEGGKEEEGEKMRPDPNGLHRKRRFGDLREKHRSVWGKI